MFNLYFGCLKDVILRQQSLRSQEGVQLPKGVEEEQSLDLARGLGILFWNEQLEKDYRRNYGRTVDSSTNTIR